ncbi:DUF4365 domain-containing protein [Streptomyces barringtoniae]|uniref:DUF4365 domain-containing protein n=1 Tax=Streptomyces barringtoniae TaxID=2892029 RepID=UPI001E357B3E|nr:DUF4365 domain-containing protein [Streptomyces barringtoniae]MCC5479060.1 DUF4365 domain-containing protein [Streptomyces barringtoniae]
MTVPLQREGSESPSIATLSPNGAKGRFGVAYVRSIVSQAGVGFTETSPDEDVLAVDGSVDFAIAPARIQIKCSSRFSIAGTTATWHSEFHWRERWSACALPVYFILVILDFDDRVDWIDHQLSGTHQKAAAFWVRVNRLGSDQKIHIPKSQRLTVDSLQVWAREVEECF